MYLPMNYEQLNTVDSSYIPSMVKSMNNKVFDFWVRSLFQRACSTIIINEPEAWNGQIRDFLYYCLFRFGYVAVFNRDEVGTVFQPCTLYGYNFYYQPTNALIVNPTLNQDLDLKIGEECAILKLTPDYMGIWDIITYYAEKLATLDSAINMSIINNKFAYIVGAKNKAAAEALKKLFDKINRGEPAVFFDKKLQDDPVSKTEPWQFLSRDNIRNSYITDQQLQDFQTLINNFDMEIGIPVLPYQKKERMVTYEAESRIIDATSRSVIWFDTLTRSIDKVKELYPDLELSIELRYDAEKDSDMIGGDSDELS